MAAKIKFDYATRLLEAANNTINDLLRENYELKKQMHILISGENENTENNRRTIDYAK